MINADKSHTLSFGPTQFFLFEEKIFKDLRIKQGDSHDKSRAIPDLARSPSKEATLIYESPSSFYTSAYLLVRTFPFK